MIGTMTCVQNHLFNTLWIINAKRLWVEDEESIDKLKNLPVIYYNTFQVRFINVSKDKYNKWFDILKCIFDRWMKIYKIAFQDMALNEVSQKALQLNTEVYEIRFQHWSEWDNLTADQSFLKIEFNNLVRIDLSECNISSCELNRFIRVLSQNKSIRHNLKVILICMFDIYDQNLLHNMLKAKSYGFAKWLLLENSSLSSKYTFIDFSERKIIKQEIFCIKFILIIDIWITKSIDNYKNLERILDYYEFEDESDRLSIDKQMERYCSICNKNKQAFILHAFLNHYDPKTNDYLLNKCKKDEKFWIECLPKNLAKCQFIRFKMKKFQFIPYFEAGVLKLNWYHVQEYREFKDHEREFHTKKAWMGLSEMVSIFEKDYGWIENKLFYGEERYLDNYEHFQFVFLFFHKFSSWKDMITNNINEGIQKRQEEMQKRQEEIQKRQEEVQMNNS